MIAAVNSTKTMASLPKGWRWVKLGEVVHRLSPATRRLKTHEYKERGRIAVVDQGRDLIAGYTDDDQARTGVASPVIVSGDHTKVVKYVDFDFAIGADGVVLLDAVKGVDLRFLYYGLCQVRLPDMGYGRHYQFLGDQDIPLPPLAEQKRIAAILNEQMAAVERARKAAEEELETINRLPAALLRRAFEGEL
jgi:type I restriction enzyme, S subunit